VGTPEELYATPATAFTASFIGAPPMNLLKLNGSGEITGVRPEDVRLGSAGLEATVESVEYLGADTLVAARSGDQLVMARLPGRAAVRKGETVRAAWDSQHEHKFETTTGRRRK
jgi:sn-glycerol 3-phosphate transport system ATP-binding protein